VDLEQNGNVKMTKPHRLPPSQQRILDAMATGGDLCASMTADGTPCRPYWIGGSHEAASSVRALFKGGLLFWRKPPSDTAHASAGYLHTVAADSPSSPTQTSPP
jgi:hypothetical protein